jgi:5-methylcytosine-specific restriction endonuclease McrA
MTKRLNDTTLSVFHDMAKPYHKRSWKNIGPKLKAKTRALMGSLKRRGLSYGITTNVTKEELTGLLRGAYGHPCRYCQRQLLYKNMVCDHIHPLTAGGENIIKNLQFICKACNTRKGPMDEAEWALFNKFTRSLSEHSAAYVLRQMAKGGKW